MSTRYKYKNQTYYSLHQLRDAIWQLEHKVFGEYTTQQEFTDGGLEVTVEEFDPLDDLSIEDLKRNCQIQMNSAFTEYRNSNKTYIYSSLGFPINANEVAYQNIDGCILQAEMGASTLDSEGKVSFTDFNDNLQLLTKDQLMTLKLEVSENGTRAYGVKWAYRNTIDSETDKEKLKDFLKRNIWDFRPAEQQEQGSEEEA